MKKSDGLYNPELKLAVKYLLGQGIITQAKDIADKMNYNKTTVSGYVTGNIKASLSFIEKFESTFKLSLNDFKGSFKTLPVTLSPSQEILSLKAAIRVLTLSIIEIKMKLNGTSLVDTTNEIEKMIKNEIERTGS